MTCDKCGYVLDPLDKVCPRCTGSSDGQAATAPAQTAATPSALPVDVTRDPLLVGGALVILALLAIAINHFFGSSSSYTPPAVSETYQVLHREQPAASAAQATPGKIASAATPSASATGSPQVTLDVEVPSEAPREKVEAWGRELEGKEPAGSEVTINFYHGGRSSDNLVGVWQTHQLKDFHQR